MHNKQKCAKKALDVVELKQNYETDNQSKMILDIILIKISRAYAVSYGTKLW